VSIRPSLGRLLARGLDDEPKGSAYAIVDGVDGRTHHVRFADVEFTGDAMSGAIVEVRAYEDARGRKRLSLATRSDLPIEAQVAANGATWLDRQLLAHESAAIGGGFGAEVREAMERRIDHLAGERLARRVGQRVVFAHDLIKYPAPPRARRRRGQVGGRDRSRTSPVRRGRIRCRDFFDNG
jgi:hypothetical protein